MSEPSINGSGLVATERVEQKERRNGAQIVEFDRTTFTNPLGGVTWVTQERRVLTRSYSEGGVRSVESVFRADDAGNLVQSDRIVSREWRCPKRTSRGSSVSVSAGPDRENEPVYRGLVKDTDRQRAPE